MAEQPISMIELPYNHLIARVQLLAQNARTASAPSRHSFGQLYEVDQAVMKRAQRYLPNDSDRTLLQSILTASDWSQTCKNAIDEEVHTECPLCGAADQDFAHIICNCPAIQHVRDQYRHFIEDLPIADFPPAVQRGVAPAMCYDNTCSFWGQPAAQLGSINAKTAMRLGITNRITAYGLEIDSIIHAAADNTCARKLFDSVRGNAYVPQSVSMPPIEGIAPVFPNVYTDGSVLHPETRSFRLGAYAVWHPDRPHPPPQHQHETTVVGNLGDAVASHWAAPGPTNSAATYGFAGFLLTDRISTADQHQFLMIMCAQSSDDDHYSHY